MRTSTRLQSGQYFVPHEPARATVDGFENFLLVGYNDDLHTKRGINSFSAVRASKGAFIVKGFKGLGSGLTIPTLSGRRSERNDCDTCPNRYNPYLWVPYDGTSSEPTILECINAQYCDMGKKYMLASYPNMTALPNEQPLVIEDEFGLTDTHYYEVGGSTRKVINSVPFWSLGNVFRSVEAEVVEESTTCGYWSVPYELVDLAISSGNSPVAFDMPIKWARSSYSKGKNGELYDEIRESTHKVGADPLRDI